MGRCLIALFGIGTAAAGIAAVALQWPGGPLDAIWRIKPSARVELGQLGAAGPGLMAVVAVWCAVAAIGLVRRQRWSRWISIALLGTNGIGDGLNAVLQHDYRTLVGIPIATALIVYLMSRRADEWLDGKV